MNPEEADAAEWERKRFITAAKDLIVEAAEKLEDAVTDDDGISATLALMASVRALRALRALRDEQRGGGG